jgi:hypothetical protein
MNADSPGAIQEQDRGRSALVRRHLRFGWWSLLVFLTLGIALEALHGFKVGWYLDVDNETRRLMWRLAHAHGVLLALVNVAFALSLRALEPDPAAPPLLASRCLLAAGVLLPGGFLLGGLVVWEGDPWVGVVLVPLGAVLLFCGVLSTARRAARG